MGTTFLFPLLDFSMRNLIPTCIAQYVAHLENRTRLFGNGSMEETAKVLAWSSWANQELVGAMAQWYVKLSVAFCLSLIRHRPFTEIRRLVTIFNVLLIYLPRFQPLIPGIASPMPTIKSLLKRVSCARLSCYIC